MSGLGYNIVTLRAALNSIPVVLLYYGTVLYDTYP